MKHFLSLVLLLSMAHARALPPQEGFNDPSQAMPKALQVNWNSAFMVVKETETKFLTGSSYLIRKVDQGLYEELYFLTNNHVVAEDCLEPGPCAGFKLIQEPLLTEDSGLLTLKHKTSETLEYANIELIHRSEVPDIALLKVIVPKDARNPKPMKLAEDCASATKGKLFGVGFSATDLRTDVGHVPIKNQKDVYKRWSQGIAVKKIMSNQGTKPGPLLSTTVDLISGGSGGAILNEKGDVVAMSKSSLSTKENKFAYSGNELEPQVWATSFAVTCEDIKDFVHQELPESCESRP